MERFDSNFGEASPPLMDRYTDDFGIRTNIELVIMLFGVLDNNAVVDAAILTHVAFVATFLREAEAETAMELHLCPFW